MQVTCTSQACIRQPFSCSRSIRPASAGLAPVGVGLAAAAKLLQVVPLDRLVERQLRERVVDGEPLPLPAHQPRVLPLRQLLGDSHDVDFRSVLVLTVLEIKNCCLLKKRKRMHVYGDGGEESETAELHGSVPRQLVPDCLDWEDMGEAFAQK